MNNQIIKSGVNKNESEKIEILKTQEGYYQINRTKLNEVGQEELESAIDLQSAINRFNELTNN